MSDLSREEQRFFRYDRNRDRLESNHRIGRIFATWDRMGEAKQSEYLQSAEKFLDSLEPARKGWARNE